MFSDMIYNLPVYLMRIPVILLSLTLHEISHGWIASRLGDPTAKNLGRLSLNPLKHLDPIGTIMMLVFGFGWAKPVPIDVRYFKDKRRGMALTALAGPVSNLMLAFSGIFIYLALSKILNGALAEGNTLALVTLFFFQIFYTLNLYLAVFNLIPVPPLDGSRVLFALLPERYYFGIMKYERFIMLGMMLLLFSGILGKPLFYIVSSLETVMKAVIRLIPFL